MSRRSTQRVEKRFRAQSQSVSHAWWLAYWSLICVSALLNSGKSAQPLPASSSIDELEARSSEHPFDDELRLLALDLASPDFQQVLDTMIPTDLEAEWQRVATADNYQTFVVRNGGTDKVTADAKLHAAYEVRREIAKRFIELVTSAYQRQNRHPPFDQQKIDELCAAASRARGASDSEPALLLRALMPCAGAEQNWPQFRGPSGQGIVLNGGFPLKWSATENVRWKTKLPGAGNSSPVIWGSRLFVTAASADGMHRWLLCYDCNDGRLLWQQSAKTPEPALEQLYEKNTYASSTPITDGQRVIAFLGNSGLLCCDLAGEILWQQSVGTFPTGHGPGSTPVLYRDKVILVQDQNAGESVFVALDKNCGRILWRHERPAAMCWSTPIIVRAGSRDELIFNGSNFIAGYDPDLGDELWRANGTSREAIPMPVVGGGWIFSASGRNGPILAMRPGGNGDISSSHVAWTHPRGGPHVPTPVWVDGRLFMVNDMGIATAHDARTGKLLWQRRLPGRFSMSILSAGDKLLATNEASRTYILRASDQFAELAKNDLGDETVLATPAIVGGRIYFRTAENLICIADSNTAASEGGSH